MNKKKRDDGMSLRGAVLVCLLLIIFCTATVILNEGLAAKIGLGFNAVLAFVLLICLVHFIWNLLFNRLIRGRIPALKKIDDMDGESFEVFCAGLLRNMGFSDIAFTRKSADQGTDLIAWKDDLRYAIQCKRYAAHVGNKAVQEAFAGKVHYDCDVAAVITNSYFTAAARTLAETTGVQLWDRDFLKTHTTYFPAKL